MRKDIFFNHLRYMRIPIKYMSNPIIKVFIDGVSYITGSCLNLFRIYLSSIELFVNVVWLA